MAEGKSKSSLLKWIGLALLGLLIIVTLIFTFSKDARQAAEVEVLDKMGDLAVERMKKSGAAEGGVAADFINIPIEARKISDGVYQATGVADALTKKAKDHLIKKQPVHALHLADIVLGRDGADKGALQVRKAALQQL